MKKILVVDNHPVVLKFMTQLLEKDGHRVMTAENGLDALDVLARFIPDIIFIDLIMPNIDGRKLCQIIRKNLSLKDTLIVVLSAIAAEQKIDLIEIGADACVAKGPFNKMADHIRTVVNQLGSIPPSLPPDRVIGIGDVYPRNITEELLSFKRHFEAILDIMSEGILEITQEARIVYANPVAVSLVGIAEEKLLASSLIDWLPEKEGQRIKQHIVGTTDVPRAMMKDLSVVINAKEVLLSLLPIIENKEKTFIIILNDVSERKRMEAQLLQAQKMEAIATLAGGIAHDFNNLLMVVQGNVSLMLLDLNPAHSHYEMLKNIEKQVQSGSRLTSQLLGYARRGKYAVRPLVLNQLFEETIDAFARTRKNITIHKELTTDLLPIEADQGQIEQVLMNLLVNAADAMPESGNLYVKTANVTQEEMKGKIYNPTVGSYVLFSVTDTGIGMNQETLDRIFEPFFTTKELGRGTGLGLASVYGIVKGHDGYIDVESKEGVGTTFKIYLPASEAQAPDSTRAEGLLVRGTETILLIEDEESVLEVGEKSLKAMGYQVLIARDGKEAIELFRKSWRTIDLVILDIILPAMGGSEIFDYLKKIHPKVKVLLSSGYSIDGEATKLLERGCQGFIQKPFDLKQLSRHVRAILDK